jgi:hypothetical protein
MELHNESIDIVVAAEGGEFRQQGRIGGDPGALSRAVRKLESRGRVLVFMYEAGPCGFGIYRSLKARGHVCWVVAPPNMPRFRMLLPRLSSAPPSWQSISPRGRVERHELWRAGRDTGFANAQANRRRACATFVLSAGPDL